MRLPKLGLFARLFFLFGVTTILLGFCMAAAKAVFTEEKIKSLMQERHDGLLKMLVKIENKAGDADALEKVASEIKGDILLELDGKRQTTDPDFPAITELLPWAEPIGELQFVKHRGGYYLLHQSPRGWVAVMSTPINFAIYPWWAVYWPWLAMLVIIGTSYLMLRRLLAPVFDAVQSAKAISQGDFAHKIHRHPKNELSELTLGINRMADELKSIFDAKNELLLAISHELRTPLARMQISLAMLGTSEAKEDMERDLNQMDTLIGQLLEGERLDAGHKSLHLKTLYLPTLISEVLSEVELTGRVSLPNTMPEIALKLDMGRMMFLLRNLLHNSLKHNPPGTRVSLLITEQENQLCLVVADNGKGIPQAALPKLFDPFYCVNNTTHRSTQGTGLGLYLCKKIALAHGGDLTVQSEPGKGCRFILTLPLS